MKHIIKIIDDWRKAALSFLEQKGWQCTPSTSGQIMYLRNNDEHGNALRNMVISETPNLNSQRITFYNSLKQLANVSNECLEVYGSSPIAIDGASVIWLSLLPSFVAEESALSIAPLYAVGKRTNLVSKHGILDIATFGYFPPFDKESDDPGRWIANPNFTDRIMAAIFINEVQYFYNPF